MLVLSLNHLAGLFEKAKEKTKEATDHARPNIGEGISHVYEAEKQYPSELFCDVLGKCTHRIMAKLSSIRT
jgi:hypothetical protein